MSVRCLIILLRVSVLVALCLLVVFGRPAQAYIDAGTGSYVLQVVIASILAGAFVVKSMWGNIVKAVRRLGKRGQDDN